MTRRRGTAAALALLVLAAASVSACTTVGRVVQAGGPAASPGTSSRSTTSGGPSGSPSARPSSSAAGALSPGEVDVTAENDRAGSPGWLLPGVRDARRRVEGFVGAVSVLPGQPLDLYLDATARTTTVSVFRVGWYGGALGRLVTTLPAVPVGRQPAPVTDPATRAVRAPWRVTTRVPTTGWPEGAYLLRFDSPDGARSYAPVTLRSTGSAGRIALVQDTMTWAAYNTWGGRDLYGDEDGTFSRRSFAVSFDRPYDNGGVGNFVALDLPAIARAERLGLRLSYYTNVDVAADPAVVAGARGLVSMGHDEYWTVGLRDTFERARDAGVNTAFLGANTAYWRVRLAASPLGPNRVVVGYKSTADPVDGAGTTVRFRDRPDPRPEELLTGQRYDCFPARGDLVVRDPGFALFRGTGARSGSRYPGLVGIEVDRPYPVASTPRPLQVPALSPVRCGPYRTWSGFAYHTDPKSGAGVLSVGTMSWVRALRAPDARLEITVASSRFAQVVTDNLFRAMAAGPMGNALPATDDLDTLDLPRRSTTNVS